jgi:hypothetical protein
LINNGGIGGTHSRIDSSGVAAMIAEWDIGSRVPGQPVDRRAWLRRAAGATLGLAGLGIGHGRRSAIAADDQKTPIADEAEHEIKQAETAVRKVTSGPLLALRSTHYQAIGDASTTFIKLILSDCEQVALDYLNHYRTKKFDIKLPDRRLILIIFQDERPFLKYYGQLSPSLAGFYSRRTNWLALYDFRQVPMKTVAAGQSNLDTVTHEATHQLNFNTGLLDRQADLPHCISEGLAMYSERRKLRGPSEPGQVNLRRLDELAHVQRRTRWIPVTDLISDKPDWYGGDEDHRALGYAESWVLVYHLMTDPIRLPQFRNYLESIRGRKDRTHRLDDAGAHFGDLAQLDRELRQVAIRLQQAR